MPLQIKLYKSQVYAMWTLITLHCHDSYSRPELKISIETQNEDK